MRVIVTNAATIDDAPTSAGAAITSMTKGAESSSSWPFDVVGGLHGVMIELAVRYDDADWLDRCLAACGGAGNDMCRRADAVEEEDDDDETRTPTKKRRRLLGAHRCAVDALCAALQRGSDRCAARVEATLGAAVDDADVLSIVSVAIDAAVHAAALLSAVTPAAPIGTFLTDVFCDDDDHRGGGGDERRSISTSTSATTTMRMAVERRWSTLQRIVARYGVAHREIACAALDQALRFAAERQRDDVASRLTSLRITCALSSASSSRDGMCYV